ncbi:MAG TPA: hypothetical protein VIM46_05350 [Luteolibacter sp.]
MKTSFPLRRVAWSVAAVGSMAGLQPLRAIDLPDRPPPVQATGLSGFYKISSCTDPLFPGENQCEWFFDFGEGVRSGRTSGTVAVSLRQNPHVRVRILVWQLDPATSTLILGNQTEEGSRRAVALAAWKIGRSSGGVSLQRGSYHVSLTRASAAD